MKRLNLLLIALFISSLSVNSQTKKEEFKVKKVISSFIQKVKKIEDRDRKEKVLESFVSKLKEINNKSEEEKEFNNTLDSVIDGFDLVKGGSNDSLNSYAEYIESEFNQASDFTDLLIYLSIPLLTVLLLVFLL